MKRLVTSLVSAAALWTAACSGGGSTIPPPPPAGKFTLASLKGTYAFVTNGEVCAGTSCTPTPLARTGSFTSDGAGNIMANSVYDLVNFDGSGTAAAPIPITGGKYTMNSDGRGTLTLDVNSGALASSLLFGIVLTSGSSGTTPASDGLMIDETSPTTTNTNQASTGSGNFVLQNTAAFQISTITGPYVFDFTGLDGNSGGPFPLSVVGQFNANGTGQITGGVEDANDDFTLLSNGVIGAGTVTPDPTNLATSGRGTATIAGQDFAFYIVDSGRVRLISINAAGTGPMLNGDAVQQATTIPASLGAINSSFVFLVAGAAGDTGGGLIRVGRFTANGASPLTKMFMDQNDATVHGVFNGLNNGLITSYDASTGRGVFSFNDSSGNTYSFVFYLSSANAGVIQDASVGNVTAAVADGSILVQSGSPFTSSNISGAYGLNWSGVVTNRGAGIQDEEDLVSQVKVSSLSLTGTSDIFQFSSSSALMPNTNVGTTGQINFNNGDGTNGDGNRVSMAVNLSATSQIHMVVYIANPQLAFFANSDNNGTERIIAGILKAQQ
jgi:hypothetical protein